MLHSTCANELLYYISATTPSTARPRITVRRRRAAPGTPTDRGPREDVARPCNAIDAAVLVVPWPAPSLSTASQPPLVPQLYGKSRTVVLSRAIDLSRFAGRAAPGPGRAGPGRPSAPSGWNDGLSAWCATSASRHKGSALSTTHRSLAAACSAARRQRWWGAAAPTRQLLRRGAARRRARAHSVDGWTTVYDQDGRPRAMPDELVGAPANRCCALLRQHDEPPYTHCSHKNARRATRASHTHYRHTTSATRRPAREKRTAHFKFVCDRAPSNCAEPGSRRGRRHGLQLDGDGAASRRRYGGGRVYMELTIDGWASRPAGGLVWPDGVKVSSMEGLVRRHEADRSN